MSSFTFVLKSFLHKMLGYFFISLYCSVVAEKALSSLTLIVSSSEKYPQLHARVCSSDISSNDVFYILSKVSSRNISVSFNIYSVSPFRSSQLVFKWFFVYFFIYLSK